MSNLFRDKEFVKTFKCFEDYCDTVNCMVTGARPDDCDVCKKFYDEAKVGIDIGDIVKFDDRYGVISDITIRPLNNNEAMYFTIEFIDTDWYSFYTEYTHDVKDGICSKVVDIDSIKDHITRYALMGIREMMKERKYKQVYYVEDTLA